MIGGALRTGFLATLAALGVSTVPDAQLFGPGFTWAGSAGDFAGSFTFDCTPDPVAVAPGETVTLTVWGDVGAPFVLFSSPGAGQCVMLPGITGGLVLDLPVTIAVVGTLDDVTPCLSCPQGIAELVVTFPPGMALSASFYLQAASYGAGQLGFTIAIEATAS